MPVQVTRLPIQLTPDSTRVITRFFGPGDEKRMKDIITRLLAIPDADVEQLLESLRNSFQPMHPDIDDVFIEHFEMVKHYVPAAGKASDSRRRLIGASFTMEYAIESAALFNPSMAPALDQTGLQPGSVRFVMSLRATGEGHVSSIVFRRGVVESKGGVTLEPPGRFSRLLTPVAQDSFEKAWFVRELNMLGAWTPHAQAIFGHLGERFTRTELSDAVDNVRRKAAVSGHAEESNDAILGLTRANYGLKLPPGTKMSEVVIFPFSDNERHGIEDMRLVRFTEDDGSSCYYGTYTAFDGSRIFPQLMELWEGGDVEVHMLCGAGAKNKGMALFPRRIKGKYAMVARLDNENLYYMESADVRLWDGARLLQKPKFSWEVIQIGNCGSPLETDAGWLLLTHGVGPMRQYCIGASLLDHDDPSRVIGQTREPLLVPTGRERTGYVPNVVYSCGGMIHAGFLVLPYAMSDSATSIALINLEELLETLKG
jgi:predicted GH43/DUF377 family glycosyl hydrolase